VKFLKSNTVPFKSSVFDLIVLLYEISFSLRFALVVVSMRF